MIFAGLVVASVLAAVRIGMKVAWTGGVASQCNLDNCENICAELVPVN